MTSGSASRTQHYALVDDKLRVLNCAIGCGSRNGLRLAQRSSSTLAAPARPKSLIQPQLRSWHGVCFSTVSPEFLRPTT